jgi:hypothetical protein
MWNYRQPTELVFGCGAREGLAAAVARWGKRPVLVTWVRAGDTMDEGDNHGLRLEP